MGDGRNNVFRAAIERRLGKRREALSAAEQRVAEHALKRRRLLPTLKPRSDEERAEFPSFGDRMADRVARIGGSWGFIGSFMLFLGLWAGLNLAFAARAFDPYPFIFLNLILSMLAAIQAPVIMMSQNRQAAKDRIAAAHDYQVNLKAEIEIMALHDKLDQIRTTLLEETLQRQEAHIAELAAALREAGVSLPPRDSEPR